MKKDMLGAAFPKHHQLGSSEPELCSLIALKQEAQKTAVSRAGLPLKAGVE